MFKKILIVCCMLSATLFNQAYAADVIYKGLFSQTAVSGYDTVAYFIKNKPVKGDAKFSTLWQGAEWQFSSQANLDLFKKDPAKYAPQYGGYCAYAVALNKTASADPEVWKIIDGKLYLNYNQDIKAKWDKKTPTYINQANKNWPHVLK